MANSYFNLKRALGLLATMLIFVAIMLFFNFQFGTPFKVFGYIAWFVFIAAIVGYFWFAMRIRARIEKLDSQMNKADVGLVQRVQKIEIASTGLGASEQDARVIEAMQQNLRKGEMIRRAVKIANDTGAATSIKQYKDPLWLRLVLMAIMIGWFALIGYSYVAHRSVLAALFVGAGALSLWAAPHYIVSKQPIALVWFGGFIKYEIEPGKYTTSVVTMIVLGAVFIFLGTTKLAVGY
jgi:hypothetical protein